MELGIGLVYDFPMKALPELRGVRIEAKQPHITGPQDSTANSGVALDHGVLVVTMTAGVPVSDVLDNSLQHDGLVLLMQLPEGGGFDGFFIPECPEPVSAILRFVGVDVLFGLMVEWRRPSHRDWPGAVPDSAPAGLPGTRTFPRGHRQG